MRREVSTKALAEELLLEAFRNWLIAKLKDGRLPRLKVLMKRASLSAGEIPLEDYEIREMNHLLWVHCRYLCNQHQVSANIPADREPGAGPALITTMQELEGVIADKLAKGWKVITSRGLTIDEMLREAGYRPYP